MDTWVVEQLNSVVDMLEKLPPEGSLPAIAVDRDAVVRGALEVLRSVLAWQTRLQESRKCHWC